MRHRRERKELIKDLILILLIVSLVGFSYYLYVENYGLKESNTELKRALENQKEQIGDYEEENKELTISLQMMREENDILTSEKQSLQDEVAKLKSSYESLDARYDILKTGAEDTIKDISEFQKEIEDSMEWFRDNSIIAKDKISRYLNVNCYKYERNDGTCKIKLGCLHLINSEKLDFHYKYDIETSSGSDHLRSLSSFVDNKGGDCEDYSLFFKAELNHLLERCEGNDAKRIILEAWEPGGDSDYWVHFGETWYMSGVRAKIIEPDYIHPIIVCGSLYDPNTGKVNGHCALGFTKEPVLTPEDVLSLTHVPVIEPQNGGWMGYIDVAEGYPIYQLTTDDDMFLFREGGWKSYGSFWDELESHRVGLGLLR